MLENLRSEVYRCCENMTRMLSNATCWANTFPALKNRSSLVTENIAMTEPAWSVDQLGALADEWIAEREVFLSNMHAYLATQLPSDTGPATVLLPDAYNTELATFGARLPLLAGHGRHRVVYPATHLADFQRQLDDEFGATVPAEAQRLATLAPPAAADTVHNAVRQALALMQHILHIYKEMHGVFDFDGTSHLASRVANEISPLPGALALPAFQRYWLLDGGDMAAYEPPAMLAHQTAVSTIIPSTDIAAPIHLRARILSS